MERDSLLVDGEILLYGDVGDPWCWGDGFSVSDVAAALAEHGPGDVTVRINSGGGIAFEGVAIYSLLLAHAGTVTTVVDGIAASAASLILMAGAVRQVRDGAMVMIHDASGVTFGTAAEHLRAAVVLDKLSEQYAGIYAGRAGLERAAARDLMKAETWFSAEEALTRGLATARLDDLAAVTASFDYRVYARAPKDLPTRARPKPAPKASAETPPVTTPPAATQPDTTPPAPAPAGASIPPAPDTTMSTAAAKTWAEAFYADLGDCALPLATIVGIVAKADTREAADTALAAAVAAAKNPPAAPPVATGKDWVEKFYASAHNSGLGIQALNGIVAKASSLEAAKDALIDAMAAGQSAGKPSPAAGQVDTGAAPGADKADGILAAVRKAGGRVREPAAR